MRQIISLIRDTWYMWCLFTAIIMFMAFARSLIFLVALIVLPFSMAYFAFMRYDEHGNRKGEY